jgi:CBS domain-containing protein
MDQPISDAMKEIPWCAPNETVRDAAERMTRHPASREPANIKSYGSLCGH